MRRGLIALSWECLSRHHTAWHGPRVQASCPRCEGSASPRLDCPLPHLPDATAATAAVAFARAPDGARVARLGH
eukprot:9550063-Alexandrium_andersonii.AAC.1